MFLFFRKSENVDEWTEYYEKYSEWYSQYSKQYENPLEANSGPKEEVKQLSFEELQQQVMRFQYFLFSLVFKDRFLGSRVGQLFQDGSC